MNSVQANKTQASKTSTSCFLVESNYEKETSPSQSQFYVSDSTKPCTTLQILVSISFHGVRKKASKASVITQVLIITCLSLSPRIVMLARKFLFKHCGLECMNRILDVAGIILGCRAENE